MTDGQIIDRLKAGPTLEQVKKYASAEQLKELVEQYNEDGEPRERLRTLPREARKTASAAIFSRMPYAERVSALSRPEETDQNALVHARLSIINEHLGTTAATISGLQGGFMRSGFSATRCRPNT